MAEIFHRLHLIESYGTGIRRIFKLYEHCPVQPSIEVTKNAFKIMLPNMNAKHDAIEDREEVINRIPLTITPQMQKVLDYLVHHGQMSDEDLQELLEIKRTRAYLLTKQMNEQGLISIAGRGVNKRYKLK